VPTLLAGLRPGNDRFLDHALIYAMMEIADRGPLVAALGDSRPDVRRGALIALDQMEGGSLTREQVVPLVGTTDPALQKAVVAVIARHPDWAGAVAGLVRGWIARRTLDDAGREALREAVRAFASNAEIQDLVARSLRAGDTPLEARLLLIEALSRTPLKALPPAWSEGLARSLKDRDDRVVRQAIASVRTTGGSAFDETLRELASDRSRPDDLRVAAWAALGPRAPAIDAAAFEFLRAQLRSDRPPLLRLAAAEGLGSMRLDDRQLAALAPSIAEAGPLELPRLLGPYERSSDPAVADRLLAALAKAPGFASLSADVLRRVLAGYPGEVRSASAPLLRRLEVDRGAQEARLTELEPLLKAGAGDAKRGRTVFFGRTAACSTCHAVKNEGGRIGPDLSKIGSIRAGRDLLEAIAFPSVSFVRGYEPYVVATRDGRVASGTLARETLEAIFLNTSDANEVRIPRDQIEDLQQGRQSIMPQGLDTQLNRGDLADLLAFLQSLR
jgi:putative heme-binding domain-containing protein